MPVLVVLVVFGFLFIDVVVVWHCCLSLFLFGEPAAAEGSM